MHIMKDLTPSRISLTTRKKGEKSTTKTINYRKKIKTMFMIIIVVSITSSYIRHS